MRRLFDFNFDFLNLASLEPITLMQIPQFPNDSPLNTEVNGGSGNDTLVGTDGTDILNGFGGDGTLDGLGGTGVDTFIVSVRGSHTTTITDFEDGLEVIDLSGIGISSFDQLVPFLTQQGTDVQLRTVWSTRLERLNISDITLED